MPMRDAGDSADAKRSEWRKSCTSMSHQPLVIGCLLDGPGGSVTSAPAPPQQHVRRSRVRFNMPRVACAQEALAESGSESEGARS
eukprot:1505800-Pleurochrysis_carterae.AAC.2